MKGGRHRDFEDIIGEGSSSLSRSSRLAGVIVVNIHGFLEIHYICFYKSSWVLTFFFFKSIMQHGINGRWLKMVLGFMYFFFLSFKKKNEKS